MTFLSDQQAQQLVSQLAAETRAAAPPRAPIKPVTAWTTNGKPSLPHLDPAWCYWLAGFVDGKGCFGGYESGNSTQFDFTIRLRADNRLILEEIRAALGGIGALGVQEQDGNTNPVAQWKVCNAAQLGVIVRLFDQFPLRAKKRRDFRVWRLGVLEKQRPPDERRERFMRSVALWLQGGKRFRAEFGGAAAPQVGQPPEVAW